MTTTPTPASPAAAAATTPLAADFTMARLELGGSADAAAAVDAAEVAPSSQPGVLLDIAAAAMGAAAPLPASSPPSERQARASTVESDTPVTPAQRRRMEKAKMEAGDLRSESCARCLVREIVCEDQLRHGCVVQACFPCAAANRACEPAPPLAVAAHRNFKDACTIMRAATRLLKAGVPMLPLEQLLASAPPAAADDAAAADVTAAAAAPTAATTEPAAAATGAANSQAANADAAASAAATLASSVAAFEAAASSLGAQLRTHFSADLPVRPAKRRRRQ
ncbi:hypothetical protein CDD81_4661 [Ophiocordyceps australis]|uniref:Uncharacterized protein n=1 Tax=Ophiocordyceps australis TaxID=1399860 RepID=A0A2C5XVW1_9HYPO|nr:hypothetical protein CDD81_4661 [Ophiocordyceps australis]